MNEPKTFVARLAAAERDARRIADLLTESLDPAHAVCAAFELQDKAATSWQVEVHFTAPLATDTVREAVTRTAGRKLARALRIEATPARNWIATSLAGLPPVRAGRFIVHGAHDRARVLPNSIGIEIEAALAFGTGHHGTTRGCLIAIDKLAKQYKKSKRKPELHLSPMGRGRRAQVRRVRGSRILESPMPPHPDLLPTGERGKSTDRMKVLDIGTGTGVLAIAAAKIFRAHVLASDIDPRAVRTARENARLNHAAPWIETIRAAGFAAPELARRKRYDLVLANILLGPLQRMAALLARRLAPHGRVVLSGLLPAHASGAIAAYRAQGLAFEQRIALEGWITLVMRRSAMRKSGTAAS